VAVRTDELRLTSRPRSTWVRCSTGASNSSPAPAPSTCGSTTWDSI